MLSLTLPPFESANTLLMMRLREEEGLSGTDAGSVSIDLRDDVQDWCRENLRGRATLICDRKDDYGWRLLFERVEDLVLFKLRWV